MGTVNRSKFDPETIQRLFGHEAAEDEDIARLREYYFKSSTYDQVITSLPLRVLVGHKGIGKSALFKVAIAEGREDNRLVVVLKPDDLGEVSFDLSDFNRSVKLWKDSLRMIVAADCRQQLNLPDTRGTSPWPLTPGLVSELTDSGISNEVARSFMADPYVTVFLDDLDRGWRGSKNDVGRISSLLSAIRDLSNEDRGFRFRISLRSDVYFLVRTSDESTDKIEGSVVWNSWTNHEIFALLVKRIETYRGNDLDIDTLQGYNPTQLSKFLAPVFEDRFNGAGHWANAPMYRVLMSLTRKRPRDLVKLCSLAANQAYQKRNVKIQTKDLEAIFEEYSQGRIQDTINEYRTELSDLERLLFGMAPTKRERNAKAGYVYGTDELFRKLTTIQQGGSFLLSTGRPATKQELAAMLYKINFITARKDDGHLIQRRYFEEQRYLQTSFTDFGFDWEVHPAYRWALQPQDINSIFDSLKLDAD